MSHTPMGLLVVVLHLLAASAFAQGVVVNEILTSKDATLENESADPHTLE